MIENTQNDIPAVFSVRRTTEQENSRYFVPRLKDEFPELSDIPEFQNLNRYELYFCWLVGSPYSHRNMEYAGLVEGDTTLKKVIHESVEDCWGGKTRKISDEVFEKYQSGDLPEKIRAGIDRFKRFKVRQRYIAQIAIEQMFSEMMTNLEKMKDQVTNIEEAKKYAELSKTTFVNIKDMLPRLEQGFGFRLNQDDNDSIQESLVARAKKKIQDNGPEVYL